MRDGRDENRNQNVRWNCFNYRHIINIVSSSDMANTGNNCNSIITFYWHSRKQTFIAWHPKIASKMWQSIKSTRNTITWTRKIALCVDGVIGCGYKNIFLSPMLLFIVFDRDIESGSVMWCVNMKLFRTIRSGMQTNKDILWNSLIIYSNHNTISGKLQKQTQEYSALMNNGKVSGPWRYA